MLAPNLNYQPYGYLGVNPGSNNPTAPSNTPVKAPSHSPYSEQSQALSPFQPNHLLHQLQGLSTDSVYQNFSNLTSVLPAALPEASLVVPIAGPLLSTGIAGLDIYHTYKDSCKRYHDLDPDERWKKTADQTGKRLEYQILSAFVLPAMALASTYKALNHTLRYQWLPSLFQRYPRWYKAGGAFMSLIALNAPISKVSTWLTDWTWNPLVQHKRPHELDTLQDKLNSWAHTIENWKASI
jgi:hypothetical protein